ncbi:GNAT family N-acetyltransferase [Aliivibrio fischeri]|uniref:GNAT family N-acetyltransferase n=1 Tax=Aliivibrio fischeri TaxID=668 RepID=UPI0007C56AD1|nr:GNAT family N-acetyltransferase [Aliivibrio fischeri]
MYSLFHFNKLDDCSYLHILQFAQWMEGSGVSPDCIYAISKHIIELQHKKMQLYVIHSGDQTVGYLVQYSGERNIKFSRIQYFAIDPKKRGKGVGVNVMKSVLDRLLFPSDITSIACLSSLRPFYEKCGYRYVGLADDGKDLMLYSHGDIPMDNIDAMRKEPITQLGYDGSSLSEYEQIKALLYKKNSFC